MYSHLRTSMHANECRAVVIVPMFELPECLMNKESIVTVIVGFR